MKTFKKNAHFHKKIQFKKYCTQFLLQILTSKLILNPNFYLEKNLNELLLPIFLRIFHNGMKKKQRNLRRELLLKRHCSENQSIKSLKTKVWKIKKEICSAKKIIKKKFSFSRFAIYLLNRIRIQSKAFFWDGLE